MNNKILIVGVLCLVILSAVLVLNFNEVEDECIKKTATPEDFGLDIKPLLSLSPEDLELKVELNYCKDEI